MKMKTLRFVLCKPVKNHQLKPQITFTVSPYISQSSDTAVTLSVSVFAGK